MCIAGVVFCFVLVSQLALRQLLLEALLRASEVATCVVLPVAARESWSEAGNRRMLAFIFWN